MPPLTRLLLPLALSLGLAACTPRTKARLAVAKDWEVLPPLGESHDCALPKYYAPDTAHLDFWPIKFIRLNHHVFDRADVNANFDSVAGPQQIQRIVDLSNEWFERAPRPRLPVDDPPPRVPNRMRFVTSPDTDAPGDDGVYFHYDDAVPWHVHRGRDRNIGDRTAFVRYGTRTDSVLNVLYLAHHPDSVASPHYKPDVSGVAVGGMMVKMVYTWDTYTTPWPHHANLMHEVGHVYNLSHSWTRQDGCDDTPPHPNCWSPNAKRGCPVVSNNLMDYTQDAITLTPCQVGRVHQRMSKLDSRQRKFLNPLWCSGRAGASAQLRDTFRLLHETDLESDLELLAGAYLQVRCRLSLPAGKRVIVHPGATLDLAGGTLHNSCGLPWAGIEVLRRGRLRGRLIWREGSTVEDTDVPLPEPTDVRTVRR